MREIAVRPTKPADLVRRMVLAGLSALVVGLAVELPRFDAKECRGGAFSSGFSIDFDVRRCDLVIHKTGREIARVPLPR
jgi:hypothetical protein